MRKVLLIAVVAGGLMVAGTTPSDAQVYFSIGFGPGSYGYYPYGYYYPYSYYRHTIGTDGIVVIGTIIIIPTITGAKC
jgi:hypothetical protein